MKKIILSLVAILAVSISVFASGSINPNNKIMCEQLQASMPSIAKIGTDLFSIREGNNSVCEQHTQEEWINLTQSAEYSFMLALNDSIPRLYPYVVEKAKESKTSDIEGLKKITQEVAESGKWVLSDQQKAEVRQ